MTQLWRFSALLSFLALLSFALGEAAQEVLAENAKLSNESLLWGPYRPNLYFGVRPRIPKSLTTGLLWAKVDNFQGVQNSEPCFILRLQLFPTELLRIMRPIG